MKFYVYRSERNYLHRYSLRRGPEIVKVATVEAETKTEAVNLALEAGVTVYNNQTIWAEDAGLIDARKKAISKRVKLS